MKTLTFWRKKDVEKELKENLHKKRFIFNFLNSHDLYQIQKQPLFVESLSTKENTNLIDGFIISLFLTLKEIKNVQRFTGPKFTEFFLKNKNFNVNKKHFFIGPEKEDLKKLANKFKYLNEKNLFTYNPPYIKNIDFPKEEIKKLIKKINLKKPDYVWVCIGCPKQNILTYRIFKDTFAKAYFNVGAALDFILGKKKQAPNIFRKMGLEWLYRLITDFKYSKEKVWRSFVALKYLAKGVELK